MQEVNEGVEIRYPRVVREDGAVRIKVPECDLGVWINTGVKWEGKGARTCFNVVMYAPVVLSALSVLTVRYTVLAATCAHPDVNSTSVALEKTPLGATPVGSGARPQKYSIESWKPKNSPAGETRPVALLLKRPLGTAASPPKIIAALFGYTVTARKGRSAR